MSIIKRPISWIWLVLVATAYSGAAAQMPAEWQGEAGMSFVLGSATYEDGKVLEANPSSVIVQVDYVHNRTGRIAQTVQFGAAWNKKTVEAGAPVYAVSLGSATSWCLADAGNGSYGNSRLARCIIPLDEESAKIVPGVVGSSVPLYPGAIDNGAAPSGPLPQIIEERIELPRIVRAFFYGGSNSNSVTVLTYYLTEEGSVRTERYRLPRDEEGGARLPAGGGEFYILPDAEDGNKAVLSVLVPPPDSEDDFLQTDQSMESDAPEADALPVDVQDSSAQ